MVVLAFLVLTPSTQREGLRTLAVLSGDQAQAALVLNRLPDKSLSVQPMRDLTLLAGGRALELWAITPGLPPRSLGLVLPGQTSRLNPRLPPLPGDTVAVTLEPPGVRPPAPHRSGGAQRPRHLTALASIRVCPRSGERIQATDSRVSPCDGQPKRRSS